MIINCPNWVAERAKCNLDLVFMAIRDIVERDVKEINNVEREKRHDFTFELQNGPKPGPQRFGVIRKRTNQGGTSNYVHFTQFATGIEIEDFNEEKFQVVAEWDEQKASCRLKVNDVILEPWQVSQKVLASFFFDG